MIGKEACEIYHLSMNGVYNVREPIRVYEELKIEKKSIIFCFCSSKANDLSHSVHQMECIILKL